ncbi:MAG: AAA family ATPase [Phycisphaerales bacterium]|nr:AAA family ATPase [Hyphomonadaceae bacterium]
MDGLIRTDRTEVARPLDEAISYPPADSFGMQRAVRVLLRRRRLVAAVAVAITLLGIGYAVLQPPVYEARAELLIAPNEPGGVTSSEEAQAARPDAIFVESQVEILRSPALALQLVDRMGLENDPEWSNGQDNRMAAARAVQDAIGVERRNGTYVVDLSVKSRDPVKAAQMANTLVELYFSSRALARHQNAARTGDWISGRLSELRNEVQVREGEVEAYRAEHGLLTVEGSMLTEQQLREAESTVVAARTDLAEREARHGQVQSLVRGGGSAETLAGSLNSEVMVQLRSRQADVMRRMAEYTERYGDLHPSMQSIRAERADIEAQIAAEVQRQAQNLGNEAAISRARVGTLQAHLSGVRGRLVGNNAQQVRLRELERTAAAARGVYEGFLQRYHQVAEGFAGLGGDAQVVAVATPPSEPTSRPLLTFALLAAALGALAGALAAFLADQFDTRIHAAEDIEEKTGADMLTSIPLLSKRDLTALPRIDRHPAGFVAAKPLSAFAEAIRVLRLRILHAGWTQKVRVVAVTSALPGEGKSSIALCLARVCAFSGQKALLIDCDLRRRSLNHLLSIDPQVGIMQVLRNETQWSAAVGVDEASGAHVLPAAGDCYTAEDVFGSDAMKTMLRNLSETYDIIILDCAPVLALAEVRDVAALADGVVVVARRGQTDAMALQTALHELKAVRAPVLGVALNGVDARAPGRSSYADPLYFSHAEAGMYTL